MIFIGLISQPINTISQLLALLVAISFSLVGSFEVLVIGGLVRYTKDNDRLKMLFFQQIHT